MEKGEADADVKKKELALLEQTKKQSMDLLQQLSDAVLKAENDSKAQTFIKEMATKTPDDIKKQIEKSAKEVETAAESELKKEIKKIDEEVNADSKDGAKAIALGLAATVSASLALF